MIDKFNVDFSHRIIKRNELDSLKLQAARARPTVDTAAVVVLSVLWPYALTLMTDELKAAVGVIVCCTILTTVC